MNKTKLLKKLSKFKVKNGITLTIYDGYNSVHIDIANENEVVAWLLIDEENSMKICKFKEDASFVKSDIDIVRTIRKIARFVGIKNIYGRIVINDDDVYKLFVSQGFLWQEVYDKKYRSAKINFTERVA